MIREDGTRRSLAGHSSDANRRGGRGRPTARVGCRSARLRAPHESGIDGRLTAWRTAAHSRRRPPRPAQKFSRRGARHLRAGVLRRRHGRSPRGGEVVTTGLAFGLDRAGDGLRRRPRLRRPLQPGRHRRRRARAVGWPGRRCRLYIGAQLVGAIVGGIVLWVHLAGRRRLQLRGRLRAERLRRRRRPASPGGRPARRGRDDPHLPAGDPRGDRRAQRAPRAWRRWRSGCRCR